MTTKILRRSGVVLGALDANADGDAGAAFARAVAIDERLVAYQRARDKALRDPNLDGPERRATLKRLADEEAARLAEDAAFAADARSRAEAWRAEMLEGQADAWTGTRAVELRRQFAAASDEKRTAVLSRALDRRSPKDLPLLRAVLADDLLAEGLSGVLAPYREPVERLVLALADPEGLAAWEKTTAQLDAFAAVRSTAGHYVATDADLSPPERARRAEAEAATRTMILSADKEGL